MSGDPHERTRLLLGEAGLAALRRSRVAVLGLGGVGGAAAEQLCRAGVGGMLVVDFDVVAPSNLNRQVVALRSTLGRPKVAALAERLGDIDPDCRVQARQAFFAADTAAEFCLADCDFVLDCIDSLNPKVALLHHCVAHGIPVITSTGAAAQTDPTGIRVMDLFRTRDCPLGRNVRKRLRKLGIHTGIPAVHSQRAPARCVGEPGEDFYRRGRLRAPVGSISYLPVLFGAVMAGYVVRALLGDPVPLEGDA